VPDDALRAACFASLDVLCAMHGEDVPYRGGLDARFTFRGGRVPFLSPQKGIFRAAAQEGEAALSINTSASSPYDDEETPDGLHQARFRGRVLLAYSSRCTICRLKEARLLDAAHIAGDLETRGEPVVSNGLSLCSIHHRAFDQDLVGVSPEYEVHVSRRLLEDEDGPMLDLLKAFHARPIELPARRAWRPDRERLAERFERFRAAS
jgi:predicted restriction endonuclease